MQLDAIASNITHLCIIYYSDREVLFSVFLGFFFVLFLIWLLAKTMKAATAYTEISHTPQGVLYTVSCPNNTFRAFLKLILFRNKCQLSHQPEADTKS